MKKAFLLSGFFIASPLTLLCAIFFLLALMHEGLPVGSKPAFVSLTRRTAYAALPPEGSKFEAEIIPADGREESLKQFFARYDSPLVDYAGVIMDTAKKYDLDYRLIPAIAMQETNLCLKSKEGSHNCWGYNVTGKNYKFFDSYEQAIETVSKTLAEHYRDKYGLVTPRDIQRMYTPSSNGSWADSVEYFMQRL